ncbi:MAG: hypothetical protein A2Z11_01860 [Candidatus Woykebacteria bacterium RBG_16_43_9]|uniref:Uncharacterized protein n=1 Tax=Candidatus Woykebacteria bacterium RBG_16_43_9 TaxID=1802596 RepID=A0A1G1WGR4_9BACT|nr:MAG: hypothetical protein A2Z11_01860 [Candidatus Woykebacteria bacterium RBG_16_43_9]
MAVLGPSWSESAGLSQQDSSFANELDLPPEILFNTEPLMSPPMSKMANSFYRVYWHQSIRVLREQAVEVFLSLPNVETKGSGEHTQHLPQNNVKDFVLGDLLIIVGIIKQAVKSLLLPFPNYSPKPIFREISLREPARLALTEASPLGLCTRQR